MIEKDVSTIIWYRTPVDIKVLKKLYKKNDLHGWVQSVGHLGLSLLTGSLAFMAFYHEKWLLLTLLVLVHGAVASFYINAVHELVHGSVFKSKWLNQLFAKIFAFLGLINHHLYWGSHTKHHRYTLHPPRDLEVVLPTGASLKTAFKTGLINYSGVLPNIKMHLGLCLGRFTNRWDNFNFPESAPEKRKPVIVWSRLLLSGHCLVIAGSVYSGNWILFLLVSFPSFIGNVIFYLINNTQHTGLQDNVADFRLCCRTIYLNPLFEFLYWHMNYHTEHHMYPGVPCYNLEKLHQLIKHDLPPTLSGIVPTWRQIIEAQKEQQLA